MPGFTHKIIIFYELTMRSSCRKSEVHFNTCQF